MERTSPPGPRRGAPSTPPVGAGRGAPIRRVRTPIPSRRRSRADRSRARKAIDYTRLVSIFGSELTDKVITRTLMKEIPETDRLSPKETFGQALPHQKPAITRQLIERRFSAPTPVSEKMICELYEHVVLGFRRHIPPQFAPLIEQSYLAIQAMRTGESEIASTGETTTPLPARQDGTSSGVYFWFTRDAVFETKGIVIKPDEEDVGMPYHQGYQKVTCSDGGSITVETITKTDGKSLRRGVAAGRASLHEWIAYQLAPHIVPATIRANLRNRRPFAEGPENNICSVQTFMLRDISTTVRDHLKAIDNSTPEAKRRFDQIGCWDVILGNTDRHGNNLGFHHGLLVPFDHALMLSTDPLEIRLSAWRKRKAARLPLDRTVAEEINNLDPRELHDRLQKYQEPDVAIKLAVARLVLLQRCIQQDLTLADVAAILTLLSEPTSHCAFASLLPASVPPTLEGFVEVIGNSADGLIAEIHNAKRQAESLRASGTSDRDLLNHFSNATLREIVRLHLELPVSLTH